MLLVRSRMSSPCTDTHLPALYFTLFRDPTASRVPLPSSLFTVSYCKQQPKPSLVQPKPPALCSTCHTFFFLQPHFIYLKICALCVPLRCPKGWVSCSVFPRNCFLLFHALLPCGRRDDTLSSSSFYCCSFRLKPFPLVFLVLSFSF